MFRILLDSASTLLIILFESVFLIKIFNFNF
jgi:hypothetical protein